MTVHTFSLLSIGIGYLLGSIPTALWIGRWFFSVDITQVGSKNSGMTNVWRTLGWKPALPVALIDSGKGFLSAYLGFHLTLSVNWALLAGLAAVLGHSFSFWIRFKGGKGVLTAFGIFLFFSPVAALGTLAAWGVVLRITRIVSIASIASAIILPISIFFESRWHAQPGISLIFGMSLLICFFIVVRHRANLGRLVQGKEPRFQGKAS